MSNIHEQLGPDFPHDHTFIPLINIDGSCYINCIVQSLINIPRVQEWITNYDQIVDSRGLKGKSEMYPLGYFVKLYVDSIRAPQNVVVYEPTYLLQKIFEQSKRFNRGVSSDASELFKYFIESFDSTVDIMNRDIGANAIAHFGELFYTTTQRTFHRNNGALAVSNEFFHLVPIPNTNKGIPGSFEDFFKEYVNQKEFIERLFIRLPEVLAIKINICGYDQASSRYKKIHQRAPLQTSFSLIDQTSKKYYELYAACLHTGDDTYGGHYINLFKTKQERWVLADDANLRPLDNNEVYHFFTENDLFSDFNNVAYVLFYQRFDVV